jgi:hypothetical protein
MVYSANIIFFDVTTETILRHIRDLTLLIYKITPELEDPGNQMLYKIKSSGSGQSTGHLS